MAATKETSPISGTPVPKMTVWNTLVDHFMPQVTRAEDGFYHQEMLATRLVAFMTAHPQEVRDANDDKDPEQTAFKQFLSKSQVSAAEVPQPSSYGRPNKRCRRHSGDSTLGPLQPSEFGSTISQPLRHSTDLPTGASDAMDLDD